MSLDINQIKEVIPHRYPFLLVDRVLEVEPGISAKGIKCVSANEPFFEGHFPDFPIMPGVLIVEALAQLGAIALLGLEENKGKYGFLVGIDKFRFKRQVIPGDILGLESEIFVSKGSIGKARVKATIGDDIVASGEIMFAVK